MVIYSVFFGLYLQIIWNNFSEIKGELVCSGRITRMLKCLQSGRRYRIASFNWFLLFDQKIVSWKCSCSDSLLWIYSDEECARGLIIRFHQIPQKFAKTALIWLSNIKNKIFTVNCDFQYLQQLQQLSKLVSIQWIIM